MKKASKKLSSETRRSYKDRMTRLLFLLRDVQMQDEGRLSVGDKSRLKEATELLESGTTELLKSGSSESVNRACLLIQQSLPPASLFGWPDVMRT